MTEGVVAAAGETSVEVMLPERRSCLQLCCSGWSWVVGMDAVGGPPYGDISDDGEVRLARRRPSRLSEDELIVVNRAGSKAPARNGPPNGRC
jgi:hypothetical protein